MKRRMVFILVVILIAAGSIKAEKGSNESGSYISYLPVLLKPPTPGLTGDLFVDDDGVCEGNVPCFTHPQAAINAAYPGDVIEVFGGAYDNPNDLDPNLVSCHEDHAPTVIVYKEGLTLRALAGPDFTTITNSQPCWSNSSAIETWTNGGVSSSAAPSAIIVVADNVIIDGFTIRSTYAGDPNSLEARPNTGGIFIGGMYSGDDSTAPGVGNTLIVGNDVSGWSAVRIYSSPSNTLRENKLTTIDPLTALTPRGSVVQVGDGGSNPSTGLVVDRNEIDGTRALQGIAFGGTNILPRTATIVDNHIWSTQHNGIYIYDSDFSGGLIAENEISATRNAVQLDRSLGVNVKINGNNLATGVGHFGVNTFGTLLSDSEINNNTMLNVYLGVYLGQSGGPPVTGNTINYNVIQASHPNFTIGLASNTSFNDVKFNDLDAGLQSGNATVNDNGTNNDVGSNN